MDDILQRLESANEYCESSEARQLRKDAAEKIRKLTDALESLLDIAPGSVEYGGWPELQDAVEAGRTAIKA